MSFARVRTAACVAAVVERVACLGDRPVDVRTNAAANNSKFCVDISKRAVHIREPRPGATISSRGQRPRIASVSNRSTK